MVEACPECEDPTKFNLAYGLARGAVNGIENAAGEAWDEIAVVAQAAPTAATGEKGLSDSRTEELISRGAEVISRLAMAADSLQAQIDGAVILDCPQSSTGYCPRTVCLKRVTQQVLTSLKSELGEINAVN